MKVYRFILKSLNYFSKLANFIKTVKIFFMVTAHTHYESVLVASQKFIWS